jgi:hypothetical protein
MRIGELPELSQSWFRPDQNKEGSGILAVILIRRMKFIGLSEGKYGCQALGLRSFFISAFSSEI